MTFLRKNGFNILLILVLALMIIPGTSVPIKVFFQRLIMTSPSELEASEIKTLSTYNWNITALDGEVVSLNKSKDKVVVVNLWATWCPPCIAELPNFQNLYNEFGEEVDFYFVTAEESGIIERFIQKKEYDLPIYLETTRPPAELQVNTIPTTFVIDKKGRIVMQKTGVARWDSEEVKAFLQNLYGE